MDDHELTLVSALLRNPGRHEARLAGFDPLWLTERPLRAFMKVVKIRPLSFRSAAKFLAKGIKNDTLRQEMLSVLPTLEAHEEVQDADVDYAAKVLADQAKQSHILDRLRWAIDSVQDGKLKKAEEVVGILGAELHDFDVTGSVPTGALELAEGALREYRAAADKGGAYRPTGLKYLDARIGGGKRGEMWLIGGNTGDGKTFTALSIAYTTWLNGGTVVWVPNEMPAKAVSILFLVRHSVTLFPETPLETRPLLDGVPLSEDQEKILQATKADIAQRESLRKRWLIWKCPRTTTMEDIAKYLDGHRYRLSVDLLVIDYLEQLHPMDKRKDARAALNDTLGAAKAFAETYNGNRGLWLVSPHQISRDGSKEVMKRKPTPHYIKSDLAESARAERDSDVILWVLRSMKMEALHQVVVGCCKARGASSLELRFGFKMMENYASAYLGNLSTEDGKPTDTDFDSVD